MGTPFETNLIPEQPRGYFINTPIFFYRWPHNNQCFFVHFSGLKNKTITEKQKTSQSPKVD